jgi:hypothetical protein
MLSTCHTSLLLDYGNQLTSANTLILWVFARIDKYHLPEFISVFDSSSNQFIVSVVRSRNGHARHRISVGANRASMSVKAMATASYAASSPFAARAGTVSVGSYPDFPG